MADDAIPFKVVVLGPTLAGKSSLILRFIRDEMFEDQEPTVGAAFLTQIVRVSDEDSVKLEIWDTAGAERFRGLTPMYYRGAAAAIVVYDITDSASFAEAEEWIPTLKSQLPVNSVIVIVGTKRDLEDNRQVSASSSKTFAKENKILFFETSARDNTNVRELFEEVSRQIFRRSQND